MSALNAWISAARPRTLVAAVAPVALGGAVVAAYAGSPALAVDPCYVFVLLSCLGFALCVQVACNFANDLGDSYRGADTSARVGPRRAVSAGDISPAAMRRGIWVACGLALFLGAPVAALSPWLLLAGFLAIACALAYTLGPFPLAYRGLGDVFVVACFGVQATVLTAWALVVPGDCGCDMPWLPALLAGLGLGLLADTSWSRTTRAITRPTLPSASAPPWCGSVAASPGTCTASTPSRASPASAPSSAGRPSSCCLWASGSTSRSVGPAGRPTSFRSWAGRRG